MLSQISGNLLHNTPVWSPDRVHIAYESPASGDDPSQFDLVIAKSDGSSPTVVATGNLNFLSWHPDNQNFIYRLNNTSEVYLAKVGADPLRLVPPAEGENAVNIRWVSGETLTFTYLTGSRGAWSLRLGQMGGEHHTLATPAGEFVGYDVSH